MDLVAEGVCDDGVDDAVVDRDVYFIDVDVGLDVVSLKVLIVDDVGIDVVDCDVEVDDVVSDFDVDECVVDVVCDVFRRAFLYTLYTETPGRAFLEGRGGSKTSGCVFGFWSDIPLDNSEKHNERGSVQSVCSPESQAQTDLILALVKVAQPQFFRAKSSFTTLFCSLRVLCFVVTATWVAQLDGCVFWGLSQHFPLPCLAAHRPRLGVVEQVSRWFCYVQVILEMLNSISLQSFWHLLHLVPL